MERSVQKRPHEPMEKKTRSLVSEETAEKER